jgi:hypothetical protein
MFRKFGHWKDIAVFSYEGCSYVLQGRKATNGETQFRTARAAGIVAECNTLTEEHLKAAGLWRQGGGDANS